MVAMNTKSALSPATERLGTGMAMATVDVENKADSGQRKQYGHPGKVKFHSWTLKKQGALDFP